MSLHRYASEAWGQAQFIYEDLTDDQIRHAYAFAKSPGNRSPTVRIDVPAALAFLEKTPAKRLAWSAKRKDDEVGAIAAQAIMLAKIGADGMYLASSISGLVGAGYREACVRSAQMMLGSPKTTMISAFRAIMREQHRRRIPGVTDHPDEENESDL